MGDRWRHTQGVAACAASVGRALVEGDAEALLSAAWLHDVGYARELATTGFHPIDGACWLQRQGEGRLAGLVAHHTAAHAEAQLRGLGSELVKFTDEASPVTAALAYCDLTTGPQGQPVTPEGRVAEIVDRHGDNSAVVAGLRTAWPSLMAMVEQVEHDLLGVVQPR